MSKRFGFITENSETESENEDSRASSADSAGRPGSPQSTHSTHSQLVAPTAVENHEQEEQNNGDDDEQTQLSDGDDSLRDSEHTPYSHPRSSTGAADGRRVGSAKAAGDNESSHYSSHYSSQWEEQSPRGSGDNKSSTVSSLPRSNSHSAQSIVSLKSAPIVSDDYYKLKRLGKISNSQQTQTQPLVPSSKLLFASVPGDDLSWQTNNASFTGSGSGANAGSSTITIVDSTDVHSSLKRLYKNSNAAVLQQRQTRDRETKTSGGLADDSTTLLFPSTTARNSAGTMHRTYETSSSLSNGYLDKSTTALRDVPPNSISAIEEYERRLLEQNMQHLDKPIQSMSKRLPQVNLPSIDTSVSASFSASRSASHASASLQKKTASASLEKETVAETASASGFLL